MMRAHQRIAALLADSRAATAIEYGLIAGLIAVSCVGAFQLMGDSVSGAWGHIANVAKEKM